MLRRFIAGLIALSLVHGTIHSARAEVVDSLPLFSLVSSEIVNHQHRVAQSSNSSCSNTSGFNIQSQSDLDALSSCTTVNGNIIIESVAISSVTIPSTVQKINGDLRVSQISSVTSFLASGLTSITGTFQLLNLTGL